MLGLSLRCNLHLVFKLSNDNSFCVLPATSQLRIPSELQLSVRWTSTFRFPFQISGWQQCDEQWTVQLHTLWSGQTQMYRRIVCLCSDQDHLVGADQAVWIWTGWWVFSRSEFHNYDPHANEPDHQVQEKDSQRLRNCCQVRSVTLLWEPFTRIVNGFCRHGNMFSYFKSY